VKNLKMVYFPFDVREATRILGEKNVFVIAGGTLAHKTLPSQTEILLDIKKCGLNYIKTDSKNLYIGAGTTFDEMDNSPLCQRFFGGIISRAASSCSSQLVRNMATLGGNIARPHSFNVFPPVLLALDANVKIVSKNWKKIVPVESVFSAEFSRKMGSEILMEEIIIPLKFNGVTEFVKFSKTKSSWDSYLNAAFAALIKNGKFLKAKISFGALSPVPVQLKNTSNWLKGKRIKDIDINFALNLFAENLVNLVRVSDFKKDIAVVFFKRFVLKGRKKAIGRKNEV